MAAILSVRGVSKVFLRRESGSIPVKALDAVSFELAEREMVVLLGQHGAGKTVLVRIVLDLLQPSEGEIALFGLPTSDWTWKPDVGYLPQSFLIKVAATAEEFLKFVGELRDMTGPHNVDQRIRSVLTRLGLHRFGGTSVSEYTRDMMVRLGIAQAFLHSPRLVMLDEPTKELGTTGRNALRKVLEEFRVQGGTVLLSSTHLTDVEMVADRIIVMHQGRVQNVLPPHMLQGRSRICGGTRVDWAPCTALALSVQANARCSRQNEGTSVRSEKVVQLI